MNKKGSQVLALLAAAALSAAALAQGSKWGGSEPSPSGGPFGAGPTVAKPAAPIPAPVASSCYGYRTKGGDAWQIACHPSAAACNASKADYQKKNQNIEAIGCAPQIYCFTYNAGGKSSACYLGGDECARARNGLASRGGSSVGACVNNTTAGSPKIQLAGAASPPPTGTASSSSGQPATTTPPPPAGTSLPAGASKPPAPPAPPGARPAPPGATGVSAFPALFSPNATGRNDSNAYLLAYLSTVIYPDHLPKVSITMGRDLSVRSININPDLFSSEFALATGHLFWNPALPRTDRNRPANFYFAHSDDSTGYDPEAMVIDTAQAVIVVFRGTDRVGKGVDDGSYQWNEWTKTDFDFNLTPPEPQYNLRGRIHRGFWYSLAKIRDDLVQKVTAAGGGAGKPVWITGHSLGAGQAQLFGAYLARSRNIAVQGVYAFAAPHVGDREFRDDLNRAFQPQRLQRFEFINDTVTIMPPYAADFQRAGVRNYYNDMSTYQFAKEERWFTEDLLIAPTIFGTVGNAFEGTRNSVDENTMRSALTKAPVHLSLIGSDFCYHHPTWYLNAAYNQLPGTAKGSAPRPLATPTAGSEACSISNVALAKANNPATLVGAGAQSIAQGAQQAAAELVKDVSYTVNAITSNASGGAIPEGTYVFRLSLGGLYMQHRMPSGNGVTIELGSRRAGAAEQEWEVKRDGLVGYTIKASGRFLDNAHESELTNGGKVQLWEPNLPFGGHQGNQQWTLIKVGTYGQNNAYVIRSNSVVGHVLSSVNGETSRNGGRVIHSPTANDSPLQVWIAERVR